MRELTIDEIEELASRGNVKRMAIENFLISLNNNPDPVAAKFNLKRDAHIYKWNRDTVAAIKAGIDLAVKG